MSNQYDRSILRSGIFFLLLALAAVFPGTARQSSPRLAPPPVKPPVLRPPQGAGPLSFGASAVQIPTITAGDTYTESIPLGCELGKSTADLSVTVSPPAFTATVSPTRVTTPGRFTLTATTLPTTPENEYQITITATPVSGPCLTNSTTRTLLVLRPVRLEVQPASQTISAGSATSYNVTIRRKNFEGKVALRATDLPADVQASFSPAETSGKTSTLTLSVAQGSASCPPPAGCDFRIRGRANVEVQAVPAQLIVRKEVRLRPDAPMKTILTGETASFTVQILRSGPIGAVKVEADTLEAPDNRMLSTVVDPSVFTTAGSVSFQVQVFAGGQGHYRFRLRPTLPSAMTDVTLVPVEVTVDATPPRGVDITVTPASRSVSAGGSATYQIQIVKFGVPSVRFDISGLPPKATAVPDHMNDPTSVRIDTSPDTPEKTYSLTVLGLYDEGDKIVSQQANSVDLVVGAPPGGSVSLEADPAPKDVDAGSSRTFPITVRPQGGFRGQVTLFFQPPPNSPSVQPSFSPPTVDLSAGNPVTSTLTLAVPPGTSPGGPFQGMVMGNALPIVPVTAATVGYRILSPTQPVLSLQLSPSTFNIQSGQSFDLTASVTRLSGCQGVISVNGSSLSLALGTIDFQPVPGIPDTFRARITAGTVLKDTPATINVTALAPPCTSASQSISGTVRPKILIPPAVTASISPAGQSAGAGQTVHYTLQLNRGTSTDPISLTFTGLPNGVTATASPNPVTGASADLQVTVGNGAAPGSSTFMVTGRVGGTSVASASAGLTVTGGPAPPVITSFSPANGMAGANVQIFGSGFANVQNVIFNGIGAAFASITPSQVNATVPGFATTGPIRVITAAGTAVSASSFIVGTSSRMPVITGFSPPGGPAGAPVTILGANLDGATAVTFGGTAANFTRPNAAGQIDATVPAGARDGFIQVTTPNGTATSAIAFDVTTPDLPEIGGFNPLSGPPGTNVEINGTNLGTTTAVAFNGTPASFTVAASNRLVATVPNGATTGKITATTPAGTAISFTTFAVSAGEPVITDLQPRSGQVGFSVTIAGVNLNGVTSVTFNGRPAQFTGIGSNFIQAFVPDGATTGPVKVTTPNGTATSPFPFQVQ